MLSDRYRYIHNNNYEYKHQPVLSSIRQGILQLGTGKELSSWPVFIARKYDSFTNEVVIPISHHPDIKYSILVISRALVSHFTVWKQ